MEDLSRKLQEPGVICMLYGRGGVGKSRLVDRFLRTRGDVENYLSFSLVDDEQADIDSMNIVPSRLQDIIDQLPKILPEQSLLVVDHCELAEPGHLQQLLDYFLHHGRARGQTLVLVGNTKLPGLLFELTKRLSMTIHAVELKPLSSDEMMDFVRARCCPGLRMMARLNRQQRADLKSTQGLYSKLHDWLQQHQHAVICEPKSLHTPRGRWMIATLLIVICAGLLWLFNLNPDVSLIPALEPKTGSSPINSREEDLSSVEHEKPTSPRPTITSDSDTPLMRQSLADAGQMTDEIQPSLDDETKPSSLPPSQQNVSSITAIAKDQPVSSLLQQRLGATEEWLATSNDTMASIQIMSIEDNETAASTLNRYLVGLRDNNIDLKRIMVFKSARPQRRLYGILYGRYLSRNEAMKAMAQLPVALKANQPIPRTVSGIKDEINANSVL